MFELSFSELMLVAIIAVIVIGPKDLPRALATAGRWVSKMRSVAGNFRSGFDAMVREAELQEMEKKWAQENARIMAEHPATDTQMQPLNAPPVENSDAVAPEQTSLPLTPKPERGHE